MAALCVKLKKKYIPALIVINTEELNINEMAKFEVFHGSPVTNITAFKIGTKGNDEQGPGIYFTSSLKNAEGYKDGGKIYKAIIQIKKRVPLKGKTSRDIVTLLAKDSLGIKPGPFQEQLDKLSDAT